MKSQYLFHHGPDSYAGMDIIETLDMVLRDWSGCRSPSRAKRRAKIGHLQRVVITPRTDVLTDGKRMFMHPETARKMRDHIEKFSEQWGTMT